MNKYGLFFVFSTLACYLLGDNVGFNAHDYESCRLVIKDGWEVIEMNNDGQKGWITICNNGIPVQQGLKNKMVKLVNPATGAFDFLRSGYCRSYNFTGHNIVQCYLAREDGVPWYGPETDRYRRINCSEAKVGIARCYPNGSPGGQDNRSGQLELFNLDQAKKTATQTYSNDTRRDESVKN